VTSRKGRPDSSFLPRLPTVVTEYTLNFLSDLILGVPKLISEDFRMNDSLAFLPVLDQAFGIPVKLETNRRTAEPLALSFLPSEPSLRPVAYPGTLELGEAG
jgi:hypothetical protein